MLQIWRSGARWVDARWDWDRVANLLGRCLPLLVSAALSVLIVWRQSGDGGLCFPISHAHLSIAPNSGTFSNDLSKDCPICTRPIPGRHLRPPVSGRQGQENSRRRGGRRQNGSALGNLFEKRGRRAASPEEWGRSVCRTCSISCTTALFPSSLCEERHGMMLARSHAFEGHPVRRRERSLGAPPPVIRGLSMITDAPGN